MIAIQQLRDDTVATKQLLTRVIAATILCASAAGCAPKKPTLSEDQLADEKSKDYCMSLLVEAGAKWYQGDQVGRICERRNPTKPELARQKIMGLLGEKGLAAQELYAPYAMPDGPCKTLAEEFLAMHEKAYRLNAGEEKTKALAIADQLLAWVSAGSCTPPKAST